jgi:hypothetical protein
VTKEFAMDEEGFVMDAVSAGDRSAGLDEVAVTLRHRQQKIIIGEQVKGFSAIRAQLHGLDMDICTILM